MIERENCCEIRYVFQKGEAIYDENGIAIKLTGATIDETEQKENELLLQQQKEILEYQAHHDMLTKLANRALLLDRLDLMIHQAKRKNHKIAVLFIDLDDFKSINDSLGHDFGDRYLVQVAKKLKTKIRSSDTLARLGGDEFVILLDDIHSEHDVAAILQSDFNFDGSNISVGNKMFSPSMSIGIALYPYDGVDSFTLLKNADAAMYKAKKIAKNSYSFYDISLTQNAHNRISLDKEIRQAISKNEFRLYFQPQINTKNHTFLGTEALVRWQHPSRGLLSPAEFLPIAEDLGLMIDVNKWVIKNAFKQLKIWHKSGKKHGVLSINMSIKHLEDADFVPFVADLLEGSQCSAKWITLEITEGHFMQNSKEAIQKLQALSNLGFQIAIDDFGTGYASLAYLSKLPLHALKIDKSFVDHITHDTNNLAIVKTIIELAKNLRLDIIAEGVEKEEQKNILADNGCSNIQGYLYAKPLPLEEIEDFMAKF